MPLPSGIHYISGAVADERQLLQLIRKVQFPSKSPRSLYPQKRPFAALPRNDAKGRSELVHRSTMQLWFDYLFGARKTCRRGHKPLKVG